MSQYLDGPKVAAWITAKVNSLDKDLGTTDARTIRRWREGRQASVYTTDEILTQLGYHLSDLPDSFYVTERRLSYRGKPHSAETKERALALYRSGVGSTTISRELNVNPDTLHKWRREAGIPVHERTLWTREAVLDAIRTWTERHGEPPTSIDWTGHGKPDYPNPGVVRKWFGTFNAAIAAAGLSPAGPGGHRK